MVMKIILLRMCQKMNYLIGELWVPGIYIYIMLLFANLINEILILS